MAVSDGGDGGSSGPAPEMLVSALECHKREHELQRKLAKGEYTLSHAEAVGSAAAGGSSSKGSDGGGGGGGFGGFHMADVLGQYASTGRSVVQLFRCMWLGRWLVGWLVGPVLVW